MKKHSFLLFTTAIFMLVSCGGSNPSTPSSLSISTSSIVPSESISTSQPSPSINEYIIILNTCGGPSYSSLKYSGTPISLPTPSFYHHDFLGWFFDDAYSRKVEYPNSFTTDKDVTLYAKWDEVSYLYLYYGNDGDYIRKSMHKGDTVNLLEELTPPTIVINEVECPFIKYVYEFTNLDAPSSITADGNDFIFVATYDKSNVPGKCYLREVGEGVYLATGKVNHNFYNGKKKEAYVGFDVSVAKGASGGIGVITHSSISQIDYAYEAGCYYIGSVFDPINGNLLISGIDASATVVYKALATVSLASLPLSFRTKFASTESGHNFSFNISAISGENSVAVYLDNQLAYSCNDINTLAVNKERLIDYRTLTGIGVRCSSTGAYISNIIINDESKNITINRGAYGSDLACKYIGGNIGPIATNQVSNCLDTISFDPEGKDVFDYTRADEIKEGMTLYATHLRLYTNAGLVNNGGGSYTANSQMAVLLGQNSNTNLTITMGLNLVKGTSGASGFIVHGRTDADNIFEQSSKYIMAQITATGGLQVATNNYGTFAHISGSNYSGSKSLSDMPSSFKTSYNNATAGDIIPVTLKVVITNEKITIYVNDSYMGETNNSSLVSGYSDIGYGVRINGAQVGQTFTYKVEEN